ncbi:MAG TPA: RNA polymerase sigma factor [Thermoanaerobaculia bacterium]
MSVVEADVALAVRGDEAAYLRLVEESANVVSAIALAIVRNVDASEDVAQEVFLAVWTNLRKLRNPSSFLPWIRQITRNQAHLWLREHGHERGDDAAIAAAVDDRPSPADELLKDEERAVLRDVIDDLPEDAREVVILYYREGSSTRHVSELLGISEDAVKQRLSRARAKIREQMLARFGRTVARTAPGAAFVTVIASSLGAAAPPAAAAVAMATTKSVSALSLASLFGGIVGAAGVVIGMKHLEPIFDDQEARELRVFRNHAITLMLVTSVLLPFTVTSGPPPHWLAGFAALAFMAAYAYLYHVRLPRILERRWRWECEVDPEVAKQHRRKWMYATTSQAGAATIGGFTLMTMIIKSAF